MENTLYLHFSNEKWVSAHEFSVFLFEFVSRDDTKNIMRADNGDSSLLESPMLRSHIVLVSHFDSKWRVEAEFMFFVLFSASAPISCRNGHFSVKNGEFRTEFRVFSLFIAATMR